MNVKENKSSNEYWPGKKAKIEILKDNQRLIFTAEILELDAINITFQDRDGQVLSFNRSLVQQMQQLWNGEQ